MKSKVPKSPKPAVDPGDQVDAFTARLKHPLKPEIEAVRQILVDAAPGITEEIKWNAPGFRTTESFATVNLRSLDRLQLIFHLGAKGQGPPAGDEGCGPGGLDEVAGEGPVHGDRRHREGYSGEPVRPPGRRPSVDQIRLKRGLSRLRPWALE